MIKIIVFIYNKLNLEIIAAPIISSIEDFKKNPILYFPLWNNDCIASQIQYIDPVLAADETLREKTREELILNDNRLDLLQDGEYIENNQILSKECPEGILKKNWNKTIFEWEDLATEKEKGKAYFNIINELKQQMLELGYSWEHKGKTYIQKARPSKDIPLLTATIVELEKKGGVKIWSFSDSIKVVLNCDDFELLFSAGNEYISKVYMIETFLKSNPVDLTLNIEDYKELVENFKI